jgi:hypothetical protein
MANHRKPHDAGSQKSSGRVAGPGGRRPWQAVARGLAVAVVVAICLAGSFKLFTAAPDAAGGTASLTGAGRARLAVPGHWRHPAVGLSAGRPSGAPASSAPAASSSGPPSVTRSTPDPPAGLSGQSVTAVGDSVMVAATPALQQALPGIYIDATVGRQFSTGLQVIADLKARGLLRPVVVVGLGTNGTVTSGEISQLFAEIGPDRKLVLVNTFEARPWEQEVNSALAVAAADHPGVALADWYTAIEHRTNLLWPDGIHPQPSGTIVYAHMLRAALEQLISRPRVSRR